MAVRKAWFLFNLKPDRKLEDYIKWTLEVNHPDAKRIQTIKAFHDYVTVGAPPGVTPAWQFLEEVEVTDFDAYWAELRNPSRAANSAAWRDWVQDFSVLFTEQIG